MNYQQKMQAIYKTGMPDSHACKIVGYSMSQYRRMRTIMKGTSGNPLKPNDIAAKKIDELYEARKDMPRKKVLSGWQKSNQAMKFSYGKYT